MSMPFNNDSLDLREIKLSIMLYRLLLIILIAASGCKISSHTGDKGFNHIFNGQSLEGWEGDPAYWRVEDGVLVGEVTSQTILKQNTFLIWQGGEPADFELKLD